jgi:hypothetical protein
MKAVAALAAALAGGATASIAAAPPAPVVGCSQRVESGRGPLPPAQKQDLTIGPLTFRGAAKLADAPRGWFVPRAGRQFATVKSGATVEAGRAVTVVVSPRDRAAVRLAYLRESGSAIRFEPCRRSESAFSYDGVIGPRTGWAGGFLVTGPHCVRIEVWVDGHERPLRRTISLGKGRCR